MQKGLLTDKMALKNMLQNHTFQLILAQPSQDTRRQLISPFRQLAKHQHETTSTLNPPKKQKIKAYKALMRQIQYFKDLKYLIYEQLQGLDKEDMAREVLVLIQKISDLQRQVDGSSKTINSMLDKKYLYPVVPSQTKIETKIQELQTDVGLIIEQQKPRRSELHKERRRAETKRVKQNQALQQNQLIMRKWKQIQPETKRKYQTKKCFTYKNEGSKQKKIEAKKTRKLAQKQIQRQIKELTDLTLLHRQKEKAFKGTLRSKNLIQQNRQVIKFDL